MKNSGFTAGERKREAPEGRRTAAAAPEAVQLASSSLS